MLNHSLPATEVLNDWLTDVDSFSLATVDAAVDASVLADVEATTLSLNEAFSLA